MKNTINELLEITERCTPMLRQISEAEFSAKPLPGKWSKKELIGHLIDSAQNNIRRFVVAQYEDQPYIVYAQDFWVSAAGYQQYQTSDLIALWALLNKHMCMVLKNIPAGKEENLCKSETMHSIKWLAEDYIIHLKHHLHQVLNLEPVAYPATPNPSKGGA
jgi:DinB superfamily